MSTLGHWAPITLWLCTLWIGLPLFLRLLTFGTGRWCLEAGGLSNRTRQCRLLSWRGRWGYCWLAWFNFCWQRRWQYWTPGIEYALKPLDGLEKWFARCGQNVLDCTREKGTSMGDPVSRSEEKMREIRVEKIHRIRDAHHLRDRVNHLEASILLQCRDNVVTVADALIPKIPCGHGVVDYHFGPQRSQWCCWKSNGPLKYSHVEMRGLSVACFKRLRVTSVWGRNMSRIYFGNAGLTPAKIAKKCSFNVQIACSATSCWWTLVGTSWDVPLHSSVITLLYSALTSLSSTLWLTLCPRLAILFMIKLYAVIKFCLEDCAVVCNHYVLLFTSLTNKKTPTVFSLELSDGLIPDVEFSCVRWQEQLFLHFSHFVLGPCMRRNWCLWFLFLFWWGFGLRLLFGWSHPLARLCRMPLNCLNRFGEVFRRIRICHPWPRCKVPRLDGFKPSRHGR